MRKSGQGHHLAVTVLELEGTPDRAELGRAAESLGRRHGILHSRLRRSPAGFRAAWHPSEAQAIPALFHPPSTDRQALIHELLNGDSIDIRADGPNIRLHAVEHGGDRWSLLILWPHALLDGIGIDKFVAELSGAEAGEAYGETSAVDGPPGELWKRAEPVVAEMRGFPAHRIRSLHDGNRRPGASRFRVIGFDRERTTAIRTRMAETAGELLLLPYFACCASRAVREIISSRHPDEDAPILLSIPVQRQGNRNRRPVFHNHMVAYSLLLTGDELADLGPATRALYRKYADFMRRKLPAAMEALMRLMERCPSSFYLKPASFYLKGEICSLFHSHTGEFAPGVTRLFGSRLTNGYHVPSVSSPPGIGIFFSEYDGRLTCTLSWKEGVLSARELAILENRLFADLGATPDPSSESGELQP